MRRNRHNRQKKVPELKIDYVTEGNHSTAIIQPEDEQGISKVDISPQQSESSSPTKLIKLKPSQQSQDYDYSLHENMRKQIKLEKEQKKETIDTSYDSSLLQVKKVQSQTIKTEHFIYDSDSQKYQSDKDVQYSSQQHRDSDGEQIDKISQKQEQYEDDNEDQSRSRVQESKIVRKEKVFIAENYDDLIRSSLPRSTTINCIIVCHQEFLSMTRSYELFLLKEKKKLMNAVKTKIQVKSQYLLQNPYKKQIGRVKSNFTGTEYKLIVGKQERQLCWMGYNINLIGLSGEREQTVFRNPNKILQEVNHFSKIKTYCENGLAKKFQKYENKKSQKKNQKYELNFHGKVAYPSMRNFILEDEHTDECILFGKKEDGIYIMQVGHPFSIIEAFAIALSSLDRKIFVR